MKKSKKIIENFQTNRVNLSLVILLIIFNTVSCKGSNEVNFNAINLINSSTSFLKKADSLTLFMYYNLNNEISKAEELFPDIGNIDVSNHLRDVEGESYLGSIGGFVDPYLHSSDKLLALTIYLKSKYGMLKILYDQMLRTVLIKDKNNLLAMYLLAELRYNNEYIESCVYLLSKMDANAEKNEEIERLKNIFIDKDIYRFNNEVEWDKFLRTNPIYVEDE